jgi:DNA-binding response OmpR family regulator
MYDNSVKEDKMKKKVLIVDDDKEFCEEAADALRYEGYEVETSYDGLDASSLIDAGNYDAVVLDLKLPGMSGSDILKGIKETKKDVHVIICSGQSTLLKKFEEKGCKENEECKIMGLADSIISKPVTLASLLAAVKKIVHRDHKEKDKN